VDEDRQNMLHLVAFDSVSNFVDSNAKAEYVYKQCPAMIHIKDIRDMTPLYNHLLYIKKSKFNFGLVKYL
jgi:hypothetical protein